MAKYFYDKYNADNKTIFKESPWGEPQYHRYRAEGCYKSYSFNKYANSRYETYKGVGNPIDSNASAELNQVVYNVKSDSVRKIKFTERGYASEALTGESIDRNAIEGTEKVRGTLIQSNIQAENGTYPANGIHTDGYWYIRKGLVNQAPEISGEDEELGNISDEINYNYTVFDADNNSLSIVERLNNTVINVRNAVKSGTEFTLNIPKSDIYQLPIGVENRISIEVSDGTAKAYRNLTFTRTNTAPIIQVLTSKDLGEVIEPFTSKIKVTDEEGDKVDLLYTVNQVVLDKDNEYKRIPLHTETKEDIELNTEIDYNIPSELFKTMNIGNYELSIKAIDAEGGENEEIIKFIRTEDTIDFETKPIETEVMPKQFISLIQLTGSPSNIKIMACNNGLDTKPSWEDVTENSLKNTPYNFTNTTKTGAKWAIKIKVYLDGKEVK